MLHELNKLPLLLYFVLGHSEQQKLTATKLNSMEFVNMSFQGIGPIAVSVFDLSNRHNLQPGFNWIVFPRRRPRMLIRKEFELVSNSGSM